MKKRIYLLIILAIYLVEMINAQVVYTNVWDTLSIPNTVYQLDINNDQVIDYEINLNDVSSNGCYTINIKCFNDNNVAVYSPPVKTLAPYSYENNTSIDEFLNWHSYDYGNGGLMAMGTQCTGYFFGNFRGVEDEFIGLKFSDVNETYYGWIRVDVSLNSDWVIIKDYAYNTSGFSLMTSVSTGSEMIEYDLGNFRIFPNPTKDYLTIYLENNIESYLEILDITGKVIYKDNFLKEGRISTSGFKKGIYFVKVENNDNVIIRKIIVE